MEDERDVDDLLRDAEPVDAPRHTVRQALALVVALVGIGSAVAVTITSAGSAVVMAFLGAAMARWAGY